MKEPNELEQKLIDDFNLLDYYGKKTVLDTLQNCLERCIQQDKETKKKSFKVVN